MSFNSFEPPPFPPEGPEAKSVIDHTEQTLEEGLTLQEAYERDGIPHPGGNDLAASSQIPDEEAWVKGILNDPKRLAAIVADNAALGDPVTVRQTLEKQLHHSVSLARLMGLKVKKRLQQMLSGISSLKGLSSAVKEGAAMEQPTKRSHAEQIHDTQDHSSRKR